MGRRRWISKGWKVEETVWERKRRGKGGKEGVSDGGAYAVVLCRIFQLGRYVCENSLKCRYLYEIVNF